VAAAVKAVKAVAVVVKAAAAAVVVVKAVAAAVVAKAAVVVKVVVVVTKEGALPALKRVATFLICPSRSSVAR